MKRRTFIKSAGSTAAVAGAGVFSILKFPRGANAAGWGAWPDDKARALLPQEMQANKVLELHVNGGMSSFDTFYTIPTWGAGDFRFMHIFDENGPNVPGGQPQQTLQGRYQTCGFDGELAVPFGAADGDGNDIYLGPWAYPFRSRPDVLDRMRVVVTGHEQAAHEGANPLSFTGLRLGNPRMAGLGTAVQRYFTENPDAPGGGGVRAAPYSYVLYPEGYKPFNAVAASAVGSHPGSARPLVVSVEPGSELTNLLARSALDDPAAFDQAINYYRSTYEARLRAHGHSSPSRSPERSNYEFSAFAREHAPELIDILSPDLFAGIPAPTPVCAVPQLGVNDMPAMQARMASTLLTRQTDAARYVLWIDAGLNPVPTGGHDVHNRSVEMNGLNLPHTFQSLLNIIDGPNHPSPGAEGLLDLDDTMIVINSEFGRTPDPQGASTGTNHHPEGYVQVFIGGPISGRSVRGHMTEGDGFAAAEGIVSPAQSRMMMLQGMGIYPFSSQSYNVAESGATDELEGATLIRDEFLGVSV